MTDVAIVGAGPYGLSLAAHLRRQGVDFRIFGQPMQFWLQIAQGASHRYLKSFGFGTYISTPEAGYSFVEYCQRRGLESVEPCAISDFANYGLWVQENVVPDVECADVIDVSRTQGGFHILLSSRERLFAKHVIIATGLTSFAIVPPELAQLPAHRVSHTSEVGRFKTLEGQDVCVVGAGQSALEAAMLLDEAGARPRLVIRGTQIKWNTQLSQRRTWWQKLRSPISGAGTGPRAWLLTKFPSATYYTPEKWRVRFVNRHLLGEGAWWLRDCVEEKVPIDLNCTLIGARETNGRVALLIRDRMNGERELVSDHVIAATGFKIDVDRLSFLSADLRASVDRIERAPRLNRHFESSAPGLFFVGPASTMSFGPLFRFVLGASYTAPFLAAYLARKIGRSPIAAGRSYEKHFGNQERRKIADANF